MFEKPQTNQSLDSQCKEVSLRLRSILSTDHLPPSPMLSANTQRLFKRSSQRSAARMQNSIFPPPLGGSWLLHEMME